MSKENIKSPLKQDTKEDRQALTGLTSGLEGGMSNVLMRGAYMSARANAPDYGWLNVAGTGIKAFKTNIDARKAVEKANRDKAFAGIDKITETIYQNGGSLEQNYFDQAYDYTEQLREEYAEAITNDDIKLQHQIKGKLNAFSTSIQSMKTDLSESAGLWNDDMLINQDGFTKEQISINKSIEGKNAILNMEDGTYKWKNLDYDQNVEGSKEFFTMEDLKNALPLRDDVGGEKYLGYGKSVIEKGVEFKQGKGSGFNVKTNRDQNMKLIEEGSLQSWIWDDQTKHGSFAESLDGHPEFKNIFNNMNDGGKNIAAIGMHDKNGDHTVDFRDFLDPDNYQHQQYIAEINQYANYDGKPGISDEEMDAIMSNEKLFPIIEGITKDKLKDALTKSDHENFNEDITKGLIADFLTNRQRQMFYGDRTTTINGEEIPTHTLMVPNVPNSLVTWKGTGSRYKGKRVSREERGQLLFGNPPTPIETLEELVEAGGNYGYMKEQGWNYKWDDKRQKGVWTYNKPKGPDPFNPDKKVLDD